MQCINAAVHSRPVSHSLTQAFPARLVNFVAG